jgi:acyl-CoA dehydrogenase
MLFNPKAYDRKHNDEASRALVQATIDFFEAKGLKKIKEDDQAAVWYEDFLAFIKESGIFAAHLTPAGYGPDARWDMWRISHFNEVLSFYGLCYWYAWQVTILGLGPFWMGDNEDAKRRAAKALADGGILGFGLSERVHGADIYSTEMTLHPTGDGTWVARGEKYYIGNGNAAALISVFGKMADTGDYVFFAVEPDHEAYELVKKIDTSGVRQAYVAEFKLNDYPITKADILSTGRLAWDSSLSTVNVGKFELGWASIGICTHCLYEAMNHAANRTLYGQKVTDFPHVRREFVDSYARLVAMKLVGMRSADYLRAASDEDRRYLLYNPIVKMKVTSQGEQVVALLHQIIAAKGYEQETYFEMALRDIGMLAKLEGTEQVNMALVIKFMKNYFFGPVDHAPVPRRDEAADDGYLFRQFTGGLAKVRFPDYTLPYAGVDLPNVLVFRDQVELFRKLLMVAPPTAEQAKNVDFMLAGGELFTLAVYAQLILESAALDGTDEDLLDQIFDVLIRDFSGFALAMVVGHDCTPEQEALFREMLQKPARQPARFERLWSRVHALDGAY